MGNRRWSASTCPELQRPCRRPRQLSRAFDAHPPFARRLPPCCNTCRCALLALAALPATAQERPAVEQPRLTLPTERRFNGLSIGATVCKPNRRPATHLRAADGLAKVWPLTLM